MPSSDARRHCLRLAVSLIAFTLAPSAQAQPPRTLLVYGDSLSAGYGLRRGDGWVERLAARIAELKLGWRVVNASVSGETTAGGRARASALFARERPALIVVELGANDALRGLNLDAARANLRAIIADAQSTGARVLLIGMRMPPNYGRAYADAFEQMFHSLASTEKTALVPFLLRGMEDRPDLFQADRIHPNEQAQTLLLENVWAVIKPMLR